MKGWMAGVVMAIGLSAGMAEAADLSRPYVKAPALAPATNWSGFYAGIHGGYGWSDPGASFDPGALATGSVPGYTLTGSTGPFTLGVNPQGGFGGAQIGYNWQSTVYVYGIEADISGSGIRDQASRAFAVTGTIGGDNANFTGVFNLTQKVDVFGTVRGRLGYAANTFLIYGTGGLAWGHVRSEISTSNLVPLVLANFNGFFPNLTRSSASSDYRAGFAVGGGGEWAFLPRWTVKAEYLYIDLGKGPSLAFPGASFTDTAMRMHTVKGGINYRF
jgi:outer membrane immunogenic protein